jgi:hypothetical protein
MPRSILSQRDQWPDRYADNNLLQSPDYDEVNSPAENQNENDFADPNQDALPRHQPSVNELATQVQYMRNHSQGGGGAPGGGGSTDGGAAAGGAGATTGGTPVAGSGGVPLIKNPDGSYTSSDPEWAKLIARESGGHNIKQSPSTQDVNSGGNEAFGIFQITPGTWTAHGGQGSVYNSTPEQQAAVAADILRKNPSGSDWGAGMTGRENAQALMKGLSSPATAGTAGSTSPVAPTQTNKGTTGPDTHGAVLPDTAAFKTNLQKQFPQVTNIGGYRDPDGFNEHSSGHALDVMIPDKATQDQVRDWTLKQPNVNYVLNQQKQWNPDGSSSAMEDRGSPTGNHFDHLHVNVAGDYQPDPSATPPISGTTTPSTATTPATQPTQPSQPVTDPTTTPTPAAQPAVQQPPPTQQPPPMTIAQRKRASTFIGRY